MTWTHYRLRFRLLSPLHVGYRKVGNLMQTRRYVPGKVLWAALTTRITRDDHDGSQGSEYQRVGDLVQSHFRFSYLWPSLEGRSPYWPWEYDDFDYLLLNSYASTALDYHQQAAEEGSLHEVEFITPVARNGRGVYLVGDLWVREDDLHKTLNGWQEAFQKLQLGGERTYGWGRVQCRTDWSAGQQGEDTTIAGYTWEERNSGIILTLPRGEKLTAHARAAGKGAVPNVVGPVEPLVGWERDNTQTGQTWRLSPQPVIAYAPGAEGAVTIPVRVGENGIWEAISP